MGDEQLTHSRENEQSDEEPGRLEIAVVFHAFTDGHDEWTTNLAQAIGYYKRFKKATRCARLYIEIYTDRENDVMIYENCLLAVGNYPN